MEKSPDAIVSRDNYFSKQDIQGRTAIQRKMIYW